jgi:maltooligosyltrehalose trehalohydrolase
MRVGAHFTANGNCEFVVWAPRAKAASLDILSPGAATIPLERDEKGYWHTGIQGIPEETLYRFIVDSRTPRPDPASHFQPRGVHEASQVVDHASYIWGDQSWKGIPLPQMVMYELHVGTFTSEGTFEAVIPRLAELRDIGVNAIELMPIAQFPGNRNWGYDGVYPFAVQNSYGGPPGLKRLVNACHESGIAVILDVVYNHLGPEGNYLAEFGPYFTEKYHTPWGWAVNFDGPWSDDVRNYFIENALHWFRNYHIDALRLDAVHAIMDMSAHPFLEELAERVKAFSLEQGRDFYLIAESNLNDSKLILPPAQHGYGLDAQWLDDYHHCVHSLLTGESDGYFADFGQLKQLAKCLQEGFVYTGEYSRFRKRRHGNSSKGIPAEKFIVFTKNHDQIGNRMRGERMCSLVSFEGAKLHAAVTLLSPYIPLIFMGEEYAEPAPFKYFVSHSDVDLIAAVRKGRREEFESFVWAGELPDPQSEQEFIDSTLHWELRFTNNHRIMLHFYKALVSLRRELYAGLSDRADSRLATTFEAARTVMFLLKRASGSASMVFNFSTTQATVTLNALDGIWAKAFDSAEEKWSGPGETAQQELTGGSTIHLQPLSAAVYLQNKENPE